MSLQSFMRRGVRNTVRDLVHKWRFGDAEKEFCAFARQRWPCKTAGPLLLMHQNTWHASVVGYAFIGQIVAEHYGARLGSWHFARNLESPIAPLYEAFGAPTLLSPKDEEKHLDRARRLGQEIFDITVEDLSLGDIIYDSYNRFFLVPTAILDDPRMLAVIQRVLSVYFACEEFLNSHEVAAVFTDHAVYWSAAVLTRMAVRRGIPVYHVPYNSATIVRLDPQMFHGVPGDPVGFPAGYGCCKLTLPYHLFAKLFAQLPPEQREAGILRARKDLTARLTGAFDPNVLPGGTAYHPIEAGSARLTKAGERPRILIMLHDFCDAPHAFRSHLFEDNYQWAVWMLERASQTPYDWYIKPHPNSAHDPEMGAKNEEVLTELRARFPKVTFLPPTVSNLQLVSEGITAMFTGYGTVGHEFAYMGIPVVNAADNPHVNYGFNFHSRSVEELAGYVDCAADLRIEIDKREIEEYAYMRYIAYFDRELHPVSILPSSYVDSPENNKKLGTPEALRMAMAEPDPLEQRLRDYFRDFFARQQHVLPS
jgi:hypothetical protein